MTPDEKEWLHRLAEHMTRLREEKNLTKLRLANRCEMDHSKISRIENHQANLTVTTLYRISKGLDVSPQEMLNF
jgi:transcriptional regulator with XRE-family HTH domain